jgi:hypothetical protein
MDRFVAQLTLTIFRKLGFETAFIITTFPTRIFSASRAGVVKRVLWLLNELGQYDGEGC